MRSNFVLLIFVLCTLFALPTQATHAYGAADRGYLWSLDFDFENDFNGVLTVKVGPWKNGDLVAIEETSTTPVKCVRVGAVSLKNGMAVFDGGHLKCSMDLAAIVKRNHGIESAAIDSYGSFTMDAEAISTTYGFAPIFSHPDVAYAIDFADTWSFTMHQQLATDAGLVQASAFFSGVFGGALQTYGARYGCDTDGTPCFADFSAGPQTEALPVAGDRVRFRTGPTTFLIGSDGAAGFGGGLDSLSVDPGNSFPQ